MLLCAAVMAALVTVSAQETPRWLRKSVISPDGTQVAFCYKGDIFTVGVNGGRALQITTNNAYDSDPLWTPDVKMIVFSSYRKGSKDIFITSAQGGTPKRLTDYHGQETPLCVLDGGRILYTSGFQADVKYGGFPNTSQVWQVDTAAGRPLLVTSLPLMNMSVNQSGEVIYEDYKGYEDPLRKHHTSSVTRDIWFYQPASPQGKRFRLTDEGKFTKLSSFQGEDRNPVFAADGKTYYFLSEQDGTLNVYKASTAAPGQSTQLTRFKDNPVRFLSVANDGTLCFSWNGDLYTMKDGGQPMMLAITVNKDENENDSEFMTYSSGASSMDVSPDGKEIAVVIRGDVFVTPLELGDTRRITNTPEAERGVAFSKDGRTLYYASERNGEWAVYKSSLTDKKDQLFTFTTKFKEERVTPEGEVCFQPSVSPDGKWLAYLRNRTGLVICPANGGKEKVLLPEGVNYSYSDGDLHFEWSPDSRYILSDYHGGQRMYNEDICLIEIESGEVTDLTQSGYSDGNFKWAMGGKAMTYTSDKAGYRSHGSWGAEGDIYIMFFDDEAYLDFTRGEDLEKIEDLLKSEKQAAKDKKKEEKKDSTENKKPEKIKLELEGRFDRIVRLTRNSGRIGDYVLTPDGKKLFYSVQLEKNMDLVQVDRKDGSIKVVKKGFAGRFIPSPDWKSVYVVGGNSINKADPNNFSTKAVTFKGEFEYFPDKEREYIFDHCWRQVKEKWYVEDMHGVDWAAVGENYRQFLPYVTDNFAFREILSEMLGELNGSHTGGRYHGPSGNVGHLGVIFDEDHAGKGLKVKEFLPYSNLRKYASDMKEGDLILAIDGKPVEAGTPWYRALAGKSGKRILITVKAGGKEKDVIITPSGNDDEGFYQRWVRNNEKRVEELSGGKVGYVHVRGMNSASFREVYSKALGKYRDCDALIVDTRNNGGGWLHNDLATFLDGKLYTQRKARGVYMAPEPYDKWVKPSCVVVCEANYSDACGFPYCYRALGTGKIIGAPVPGTATSVWWENQVDPSLVFGIPQIGSWSVSNDRYLENLQLEPDITVYNDPESVARGEDKQLEAAVAEMLKEIAK